MERDIGAEQFLLDAEDEILLAKTRDVGDLQVFRHRLKLSDVLAF